MIRISLVTTAIASGYRAARVSGSTVYSPWMGRGGDALTATLELVATSGGTVTVEVYTKNSDATSNYDGANAVTSGTIELSLSSPDRQSKDWNPQDPTNTVGIKELVRYKIAVTGTSGSWALFRMLAPVWYDNVDAD